MEDSFKKAQKPWSKLLAKVNKAKVDYHTACKTEKSASNQERNATADSSLSPDQVTSPQPCPVVQTTIFYILIKTKNEKLHVKEKLIKGWISNSWPLELMVSDSLLKFWTAYPI